VKENAEKLGVVISPGIGFTDDTLTWVIEVEGSVDSGLPGAVSKLGANAHKSTYVREILSVEDLSPIEITAS
jgi:hypothetical protein